MESLPPFWEAASRSPGSGMTCDREGRIAGEAICWALGQAVGTDLSSFLGQEGILHPPLALDFSEGWPI